MKALSLVLMDDLTVAHKYGGHWMGFEINSSVERRRRWSEADEPIAKVAEVARQHEFSRSMLLQRQPIGIDTGPG